jgi:hypothetical protein
MLSLVRRMLNVRLSWPRLEQRSAVTNHFLTQPVLYVRERSSPTDPDSRSASRSPHTLTPAFHHSQLLQTLSRVERRSEHSIWLLGTAALRTLRLSPSASTTSLGLRPNAIMHDVSAAEMTTRITRRLRRVEQAPLSPEPRLVAGAASTRGFDEIVGTPARRLYHDASPVHPSEPGGSGLNSASINVTHLTDEVMRQIDRRLVAFRERMGKI